MISIKTATEEDLQIVHTLAHQIWPLAYSEILSSDQLEYMLELIYSPFSLKQQLVELWHNFLIVLDNDHSVGFASFSQKEEKGTAYRLHKIYVSPQKQGTGTGKLLLTYIINSVKSTGGTSLELNVNRQNKARYFYEKSGFEIIAQEDIDIGKGYFMNDFIMRLCL